MVCLLRTQNVFENSNSNGNGNSNGNDTRFENGKMITTFNFKIAFSQAYKYQENVKN